MKKLILLFLAISIFSCSSDDDSPEDNNNDGISTFKVEFSRNGNTDEWYDELEFKTSPSGWDISTSDMISDGDLAGSEVFNVIVIESREPLTELTISYFTTPYFDGINFLDNSNPTFLNVSFKVYEDGVLIDTKNLALDGTIQATKDFEYNYIAN